MSIPNGSKSILKCFIRISESIRNIPKYSRSTLECFKSIL